MDRAISLPGPAWLRLSRRPRRPGPGRRRRAAGGAGRARGEPRFHAGGVEPVAARREHAHADALSAALEVVVELGQADGALGLRPHAGDHRAGARAAAVGVGEWLRLLRLRLRLLPRGAAAAAAAAVAVEAAEEDARGVVEAERDAGEADEDDDDGRQVGQAGAAAGVGAPLVDGTRRRPRARG